MFTDQDIQSFQTLYEKTFDEEITVKDAERQATALITLVRIVYGEVATQAAAMRQQSTAESDSSETTCYREGADSL